MATWQVQMTRFEAQMVIFLEIACLIPNSSKVLNYVNTNLVRKSEVAVRHHHHHAKSQLKTTLLLVLKTSL